MRPPLRFTSEEPLSTEEHFPFAADGIDEGEPVFIVGNPGSTSRLQTVAELIFRRDVSDRAILEFLRGGIRGSGLLFSGTGPSGSMTT